MRLFLCVAATALLPLSAQANEPSAAKTSSIMSISCEHCPPLKSKGKLPQYQPPALSGHVQQTVIRNVDGKKQIERAEQWLGGAPVRYVSRSVTFMPPEASVMMKPETNIETPSDGVDATAKTSAVDSDALKPRN